MNKEELRLSLKKVLSQISKEQRVQKSKKICQNLAATQHFKDASVVMVYMSLPYEVDTRDVILSAWQQGKTVAAPRIEWEHKHMLPVEIHSLESDFTIGQSGIRNPVKTVPVPFEQIDLVVAPGLGFDRRGNRLGKGGAYYDRFFANEGMNAIKCGFAFKEQVVESVPTTVADVPMDLLATDEEVIYLV
jgi:5-formyltetrahydrofolate cyclo-ligase